MPSLPKVGIDIGALSNVTEIDFNISQTPQEMLLDIPSVANQVTGGFLGLGILVTLFIFSYRRLTSATFEEGLKHSKVRSICLASITCSMIGLVMTAIGYFSEAYPTFLFMGIAILSSLWVKVEER